MEIKLKSDISTTTSLQMLSQYFKQLFPIRDKINNLYIKGWKERFDKNLRIQLL